MARENIGIQQQLQRAMGEFCTRYTWDHVCTLTFRESCGPDAAGQYFRRFVRQAETLARQPVYWFMVVEQSWSGHPHIHALLRGTHGVAITLLDGKWRVRHGHAKIVRYCPGRAAAYYVTKTTASDEAVWDFRFPVSPR